MIENTHSFNRFASALLVLGIVYILGPLWVALMTASHSYQDILENGFAWYPGTELFANIGRVFAETRIPIQMLNSLLVALMISGGICLLSFLTAFALVFLNLRLAPLIFATILATIMLPLDIRVVPTYQVASNILAPIGALLDLTGINAMLPRPWHPELSIVNTHLGLALPLIAHGTGTFMFRQFFRTIPMDLAKAARMDGAGAWRFMIDVLLPLSRSSLAALFVLMFLGGWTQYLWPMVASSTADMQTAVVGLARLAPDNNGELPDYPLIMAAACVVSIIPLTMIALLQRFFVRGMALSEK